MQLLKQTRSLEDFLPHVMINTVGDENSGALPKEAALSFIRNAVISFAERSGILKERQSIDIQCGLGEYPLETISCETIIGVKSAHLGNFTVEDCGTHWSWGNVVFKFEDDVLHVHPVPDKDLPMALQVEMVLAPSRDACEVDSVFYDKWFDAVVNGAMANIHRMPNMPWSSMSRADYCQRMFNEDVGRATVRRVLEGRRETLRVAPNQNFVTYRSSQRRW